jgi:phosphopantethiene-protein transferase
MLAISLIELNKKEQHPHAHRLLRECLKPFGVAYNESTPVIRGKQGKPSLAEYPEIRYNLSHGDGIAACIVGEKECGIDCERVRQYREGVVKKAFSDAEKALFETVGESEKNLLFFRLWTLKESYIKAIGIGLSYPLAKAEFILDDDKITVHPEGFRFRQYVLQDGKFVVSVCER